MKRATASRLWMMQRSVSAAIIGILLSTSSFVRASAFNVELRQPGLTRVEAADLLHTLANDLFVESDGTVYVRTGDIPAMWLRDSSAQLEPYVRFTSQVKSLRPWFRAVIERNARNIAADPYANAFRADYGVWERKWEVDSLAYPVVFAGSYWAATHDKAIFSAKFHLQLARTIATYECEERHFACSTYRRRDLSPATRGGGASDTGLIWCGFRPSDDPTTRPFNIPQEMFATVALRELAELARLGYGDRALATRALALSARVHAGIERYGRFYDFRFGWIYAYETDGRGDVRLMDDANIPNLLAAPLYGYIDATSRIYMNTRRFVLSRANPYFFEGRAVSGIGSPHTPDRWVWPLAIATRAMTAGTRIEVTQQLAMLAAAREASGTIPESVNADDPSLFTRAEFGWANATYADLLFRTASTFHVISMPPAMHSLSPNRTSMPALVAGLAAIENDAAIVSALKRLFPTKPILSVISRINKYRERNRVRALLYS